MNHTVRRKESPSVLTLTEVWSEPFTPSQRLNRNFTWLRFEQSMAPVVRFTSHRPYG